MSDGHQSLDASFAALQISATHAAEVKAAGYTLWSDLDGVTAEEMMEDGIKRSVARKLVKQFGAAGGGGGGGAGGAAPNAGARVLLSGAGSPRMNGLYIQDGTYNGKPRYNFTYSNNVDGTYHGGGITWSSTPYEGEPRWEVQDSVNFGQLMYYNTADTYYPPSNDINNHGDWKVWDAEDPQLAADYPAPRVELLSA